MNLPCREMCMDSQNLIHYLLGCKAPHEDILERTWRISKVLQKVMKMLVILSVIHLSNAHVAGWCAWNQVSLSIRYSREYVVSWPAQWTYKPAFFFWYSRTNFSGKKSLYHFLSMTPNKGNFGKHLNILYQTSLVKHMDNFLCFLLCICS